VIGISFVPRDNRDGRGHIALRDPHAGITAGRQRCRNSRYDFVFNVCRVQRFHLFRQSAEDGRIATFQSHNALAFAS
jgi:hypothetical protein